MTWSGQAAPAGTSGEIVARFNAEIAKVPAQPAFAERLNAEGG